MNLFEWDCPLKPISVNHAIKHGRRGSYKTSDLIVFVRMFNTCLSQHGKKIIPDKPLKITVDFMIPKEVFYTKKNTVAKKNDLDNWLKYTIDGLANFLGFNDSLVCEIITRKVPSDTWRIKGSIQEASFIS